MLRLLELSPREARPPGPVQTGIFDAQPGPVHAGSSAAAKVAFFATLFGARRDVYALRWENARSGRSGWTPAVRGGWRKGVPAAQREYLPLTEEVITARPAHHRHVRVDASSHVDVSQARSDEASCRASVARVNSSSVLVSTRV